MWREANPNGVVNAAQHPVRCVDDYERNNMQNLLHELLRLFVVMSCLTAFVGTFTLILVKAADSR